MPFSRKVRQKLLIAYIPEVFTLAINGLWRSDRQSFLHLVRLRADPKLVGKRLG